MAALFVLVSRRPPGGPPLSRSARKPSRQRILRAPLRTRMGAAQNGAMPFFAVWEDAWTWPARQLRACNSVFVRRGRPVAASPDFHFSRLFPHGMKLVCRGHGGQYPSEGPGPSCSKLHRTGAPCRPALLNANWKAGGPHARRAYVCSDLPHGSSSNLAMRAVMKVRRWVAGRRPQQGKDLHEGFQALACRRRDSLLLPSPAKRVRGKLGVILPRLRGGRVGQPPGDWRCGLSGPRMIFNLRGIKKN